MKEKHCDVMEYCEDKLKLLLNLSPHYQKLRTIIKRIYEIRSLNLWLFGYNNILGYGSLEQFENLSMDNPMKVCIQNIN